VPLFRIRNSDVAVVLGGDRIWIARGPEGAVTPLAAYVAHAGGRVLAAGDEAVRMAGKEPGNLAVTRVIFRGGMGDAALATAFFRYALARGSGFRLVPPRVVVATPCAGGPKREVVEVLAKAGARKVVTIPPAVAAAMGAGLPIDSPAFSAVFLLEKDWASFAVISLGGIVASFDFDRGIDLLLEDFSIHALATRGFAPEAGALHESFLQGGIAGSELLGWEAWAGELETGRSATLAPTEADFLRSSAAFALRLNGRYRAALAGLEAGKRRAAAQAPLLFCGPYARVPGMAGLVRRAFGMAVTVPQDPETAAIRGARQVLANLKGLLQGARA
jgi:rod shape-determining protein MreB